MGPVDENSQTFQLDCYFRQFWVDFRLQFNETGLTELPMNWQFQSMIWRPDTIVINGVESYLHKITVIMIIILKMWFRDNLKFPGNNITKCFIYYLEDTF